jgi:hypothetical protein
MKFTHMTQIDKQLTNPFYRIRFSLTIFFSTFGLAINSFGEWIFIGLPCSPTPANYWATRSIPDLSMSEQHCNQCQFRQRPCAGSTRDAS